MFMVWRKRPGSEPLPMWCIHKQPLHPWNTPAVVLHPASRMTTDNWDFSGHRNRVIEVDETLLEVFAQLYDEPGTPAIQARLPAVHSRELVSVLEKFAQAPRRLGDLGGRGLLHSTLERNHLPSRMAPFAATPASSTSPADFVLSGPHFYVGNPLSKTPKRVCETHKAYDTLDLEHLPDDYLPRANYRPACDAQTYAARVPRVSWVEEGEHEARPVTAYYRLTARTMVSPSAERTLIQSILPPSNSPYRPWFFYRA